MQNPRLYLLLFFVANLLCTTNSYGQKLEVEKRVRETAFPAEALELIRQDYPDAKRIKLYQDFSATDSFTFEAKLCFEEEKYSVEFLPDGSLIDVEKEIQFGELAENIKAPIDDRFDKDFERYRVTRTQEQTSDAGIRYEIEVRGKTDTGVYYHEYLFETDGTVIRKRTVIQRTNDMNLY